MNKHLVTLTFVISGLISSHAQTKTADSVIIRVGKASKMILSIHDKKDLETLKHYDFQALVNDMITKLEKRDTTPLTNAPSQYLKDSSTVTKPAENKDDVNEEWVVRMNGKRNTHHWSKRTYHSWNFDIGTNNYLSNGKFPDQSNAQYSVRPFGSWYVAINSIERTHVAGKFFLEWGFGASWYNFKFQDNSTFLSKDNVSTTFIKDSRPFDFEKSKLTATYLNASFVPVLDFGVGGRKTTIFDGSRVDFSTRGNHSSAFRIGLGPYVGYRVDSYTKQVYEVDGKETKEHHHDPYYLNNIRYGLRLQFGFNDVDFFFNYDLNPVFVAAKGPKLNAFSFGVTF
jgi:hypothetical protein